MAIGKEASRVARQIIARRPEVIVDDIEKDHQSQIMRAVDERFEVFRRP